MNLKPVTSSNIEAVGWSDGSLFVRFKSGPDVYRYPGVSEETHKALVSAPSVGGFFYQCIKPLPFEKVKKGEG